ncbi:MAG: pseudouridine-5'-phosphate glycosidase [Candidatus Riflebacteria bacterium]|nr:pseudouridine-5'-phosphate glycosidase [Candidatus Riflebacteria bacterium]
MAHPLFLSVSPEIKEAIEKNRPVVALESTIISHGMPYPENINTAIMLEKTVRENGAIPATIALIDGKFKIGLSADDIEFMATNKKIKKASRADLPGIISRKESAAVTVAGTMIGANLSGIKIFATGGIGGVHRGAEKTFDISADLEELSKTQVAVVSAGAKAILDLQLTLEYLETKGIPVVGYGTNEFPAFYTPKSGYFLSESVASPSEAALLLQNQWLLPHSGGVLFANPIPLDSSLDPKLIENAINSAIRKAEENGIKGKKVTPFLLEAVKEITSGKSLEANIALVQNNAQIASKIAVEFSKFRPPDLCKN